MGTNGFPCVCRNDSCSPPSAIYAAATTSCQNAVYRGLDQEREKREREKIEQEKIKKNRLKNKYQRDINAGEGKQQQKWRFLMQSKPRTREEGEKNIAMPGPSGKDDDDDDGGGGVGGVRACNAHNSTKEGHACLVRPSPVGPARKRPRPVGTSGSTGDVSATASWPVNYDWTCSGCARGRGAAAGSSSWRQSRSS